VKILLPIQQGNYPVKKGRTLSRAGIPVVVAEVPGEEVPE
jgi:hypothetical protein